jgi:hypothetical protein
MSQRVSYVTKLNKYGYVVNVNTEAEPYTAEEQNLAGICAFLYYPNVRKLNSDVTRGSQMLEKDCFDFHNKMALDVTQPLHTFNANDHSCVSAHS